MLLRTVLNSPDLQTPCASSEGKRRKGCSDLGAQFGEEAIASSVIRSREQTRRGVCSLWILLPKEHPQKLRFLSFFSFLPSFLPSFFRARPAAYGNFQARGHMGAAAASLCHSHRNTTSVPHLQPMLQFAATLEP